MNKAIVILILMISFGNVMAQSGTETVKIKTSAVCDMCKDAIEKDLAFEKGVVSSSLDVESQVLTVVYKPTKTNPDKIKKAVAKVGYDADDVQAVEKSYSKLPACCKKESGIH
jgi:periplasmic mercuric ion binding protein